MPSVKKEKPKESSKESDELLKCQEAITYLLDELESMQDKLNKISGRMGL